MSNAATSTGEPVKGSLTLGSAVFHYDIPAGDDGRYDDSATVSISVAGQSGSQGHRFFPNNPNWRQSGIMVGNAELSVDMTYAPPVAGGQLGSITLNSGTIKTGTQQPQPMNATTIVSWDTTGPI